jgi:hypothetical protein
LRYEVADFLCTKIVFHNYSKDRLKVSPLRARECECLDDLVLCTSFHIQNDDTCRWFVLAFSAGKQKTEKIIN